MANAYTITGNALSPSAPTDPDLCRVSGTLRDVQGAAVIGLGFTIRHIYVPISLATDTLILNERYDVFSDGKGAISFDLLRNACVRIELRNKPEWFFEVTVPDQATIDVVDLILPYVVSVAFAASDPISAVVGERVTIETEGTLSDGRTIDTSAGAELVSSDESVLAKDSTNVFRAVSPGTATISVVDVSEDALDLNEDAAGNPIVRLGVPATTFPTPITVNVT